MRIMYWSSDVCSSDLDLRIRKYLRGRLQQAGVSRIVIERPAKKRRITIHTARPGVVTGQKGADIEKLRSALQAMTASDVHLNIVVLSRQEIDANLVAENIDSHPQSSAAFHRPITRPPPQALRLGPQRTRTNTGRRS